jgi:hypothetical protein
VHCGRPPPPAAPKDDGSAAPGGGGGGESGGAEQAAGGGGVELGFLPCDAFAACVLEEVYCLLEAVYCLLEEVYCLLEEVYCLLEEVRRARSFSSRVRFLFVFSFRARALSVLLTCVSSCRFLLALYILVIGIRTLLSLFSQQVRHHPRPTAAVLYIRSLIKVALTEAVKAVIFYSYDQPTAAVLYIKSLIKPLHLMSTLGGVSCCTCSVCAS